MFFMIDDDNVMMAFTEGEYLFLMDERGNRHWMKAAEGMMKIPSLGTVDGSRIMGMEDGQSFQLAGKGFTVFRPGTVDLMDSVERGAQIITPKDAATILLNCDIGSGSTVIEVGAGSGALTTALIRSVIPDGRVHTIELRNDYAERAERNIKRAGLAGNWTYQVCDAREASTDIIADAIVMDMPDPWNAFDALLGNLRTGGRICAYVPNTNQLEETVNALRDRGFADVRAYENIQREMEVHPGGVRPSFAMLGHTGYLIFGRKKGE